MATTTPNYGWTVPTSTDLVKDGATAIETLGDAIDASMNTALGTKKAGMVLLNTTSFSGVSSISLPTNTFTSTYQNYKIILFVSNLNAGVDVFFRFRTAGSDNATANYSYQTFTANGATLSGGRTTNNTAYAPFNGIAATNYFTFDLFRPQETQKTNFVVNQIQLGDGNSLLNRQENGLFNATTSFDSMTTLVSAGNIEGVIYVYGMAK